MTINQTSTTHNTGRAENFSFALVPGMARDNLPAEADLCAPALTPWTSN